MSKLKILVAVLISMVGLTLVPISAASAYDVLPGDGVCNKGSAGAGSAVCADKGQATKGTFTDLIQKVTAIIAVVAGIAAVIMIIVSAVRFMLSGGDSQKVAGARSTLMNTIIGLVVIALASTIITIVMGLVS